MINNDEDDAVPWYQGIEYFLALRRLGKEVYMFSYNGEKHGLRKRINQKDYTRRLQEFFDHFLKGAPAPEWMTKGIPYLQREKEKEARAADRREVPLGIAPVESCSIAHKLDVDAVDAAEHLDLLAKSCLEPVALEFRWA